MVKTSSTLKLVRKRCAKCKQVSKVKPRERRCKLHYFGAGSYWCYGSLERITRKVAPKADDAYVATQRKRAKTIHARVEQTLKGWYAEQRRINKLVTKWERRALAAANRVAETDEQILARRERARIANQVRVATHRLKKSAGVL